MREWIRSRKGQAIVLVALAVIAVLTTSVLVGPSLIGGATEATSVAESPGGATPTPTHTGTPRPTPTPSTTKAPDGSPTPEPPAAAAEPPAPQPAPQQPAPPQPDGELPAIIAMDLGPSTGCGADPTGQTDYLTLSWGAREGNTVDVYYALTDTDVQASSGYILLGSGLATTGSVQIPRMCTNGDAPLPYLTIKVVAINAYGSAPTYYWGL